MSWVCRWILSGACFMAAPTRAVSCRRSYPPMPSAGNTVTEDLLHRSVGDQLDSLCPQPDGYFRSAQGLAFDIALSAVAAVGDGIIEVPRMAHQLGHAWRQRWNGGE